MGFRDGNIPLGRMSVSEEVSGYVMKRYNLDCNFSLSATYLEVESEITSYLRYNTIFRNKVSEDYIIVNQRKMAREILSWCIKEEEKIEQLQTEHKITAITNVAVCDNIRIARCRLAQDELYRGDQQQASLFLRSPRADYRHHGRYSGRVLYPARRVF